MSHKRIAYLENITNADIEIIPELIVNASTKSFILDNYYYFSDQGLKRITEEYHNNNIKLYDENNTLLNSIEIHTYLSYISNNYTTHGSNFYKMYLLLSEDVRHRYIDYSIAPKSVDYKVYLYKRLQPKYTFYQGFLINVEYFEFLETSRDENNMDVYNFSNPILNVAINYEMGDDGYVAKRTTTRSWQTAANIYSDDTKVTIKVYDKKNAREEGIRRRGNIIDNLLLEVIGIIMLTQQLNVYDAQLASLPLLDYIDADMNKYLKGNLEPLITTISTIDVTTLQNNNSTSGTPNWLDVYVPGTSNTITIRQYIVSVLMQVTM